MSNVKVVEFKKPVFVDALTELLRNSARQVIASAVESELEVFLAEMSEVLANGNRRVVRNGYLPERNILTGVGHVSVQVPRVRDRVLLLCWRLLGTPLLPELGRWRAWRH